MEMPNQTAFNSFFDSMPLRKDIDEEFQYDTSTFKLENETEAFEVILSPFYNEFTLTVRKKESQETVSFLKLRSVEKIEILNEQNKAPFLRIFHGKSDSYIHTLEMGFHPFFQMKLQEQYL